MYVPEHFPRFRPTAPPATATLPTDAPVAVVPERDRPSDRGALPAQPPLTLEWLVARDIDAYSRRRRFGATNA